MAVKCQASDIHIEPLGGCFRIRFRTLGLLEEFKKITCSEASKLVNQIKVMANLDITETRILQEGRLYCALAIMGDVDIRVSIIPVAKQESVVLRLQTQDQQCYSLDELGFSTDQYAKVKHALSKREGLILVSGPTGSGKSTTLYGALKHLSTEQIKILTIEDPVEKRFAEFNQVTVQPKLGLTFASTLRAFLRQDPDVIMVGEIRDNETATMALSAVQTGHLVLSTLHARSAIDSVARLQNLGVDKQWLLEMLLMVTAQRLLPILCEYCKSPIELKERVAGLAFHLKKIGVDRVYRATGCSHCWQGFSHQQAVHELLVIDSGFDESVVSGEQSVRQYANSQGFVPLTVIAKSLLSSGKITLECYAALAGVGH